jgi:hypothetical protein
MRCVRADTCLASARRWEREDTLEAMQKRLDLHWMGATHFLTRTLERVSTEMSLHVFAYKLEASHQDHRNRGFDEGDSGLRGPFIDLVAASDRDFWNSTAKIPDPLAVAQCFYAFPHGLAEQRTFGRIGLYDRTGSIAESKIRKMSSDQLHLLHLSVPKLPCATAPASSTRY